MTGNLTAETDTTWDTLSGLKSHTAGRRSAKADGIPDESRQSKEKSGLHVVGGKNDLDIATQCGGDLNGTGESSKRGQLKRPDLERVRRA